MAIQVSGTQVISNSRGLTNIASIDSTTATAIGNAGVGGGPTEILSSGGGNMTSLSFTNLDFYAYSYRLVLRGVQTAAYSGNNGFIPVIRFSNDNLSNFTTIPLSVIFKDGNNSRVAYNNQNSAAIGTLNAWWILNYNNAIDLRMSGSDALGTGLGGMMGYCNAVDGDGLSQRGYFACDGEANSFKIQSSFYNDTSNLYNLTSIAKYVLYRTATS